MTYQGKLIKHSSMTPSSFLVLGMSFLCYFHGRNTMGTSKKPRNPQRGELHLNSRWSTPWVENSAPVIGLNFLKGNLHAPGKHQPLNSPVASNNGTFLCLPALKGTFQSGLRVFFSWNEGTFTKVGKRLIFEFRTHWHLQSVCQCINPPHQLKKRYLHSPMWNWANCAVENNKKITKPGLFVPFLAGN